MKHKLALGLTLVVISGFPFIVKADTTPQVIISEVNWAGSKTSDADEWLELQNLEEEAIDLSGWSIDGAGSKGGPLALPSGATIPAHGIYLISNYDAAHSTLNVAPDFVTTAVSLPNSSLSLVLRDGSGAEIDRAGDGGSPPAGLSGSGGLGGPASMIRSGDGWITATTSENFDTGVTQCGTPGITDVTIPAPTPTPTPEVEPAPDPVPVATTDATPIAAVEETPTPVVETTIDEPSAATPVVTDTVIDAPVVAEPVVQKPLAVSYPHGTLIINEIFSHPSSGSEWVEIVNPYSNLIPLDGWKLAEGSGTTAPLAGTIGLGQFAVGTFNAKLNNSGDDVRLIDPLGNVIDEVSFGDWDGSTVAAPDTDQSLALQDDGTFAITTTPTKDDANVITHPIVALKRTTTTAVTEKTVTAATTATSIAPAAPSTPSPTTLELTALLPNPEGSDDAEYVELMNTGTTEVPLAGWTLTDGKHTYDLAGSVAPGVTLHLPKSVTKINLNNDTDHLELIAPDGMMVDDVTYEHATSGALYARSDAGWDWTGTAASNEPAAVSGSEPPVVQAVGTATSATRSAAVVTKTTKKKTATVKIATHAVTGTVIAAPGVLGSQTMYVDGTEIYQSKGDFPAVEVGDHVRVTGSTSSDHGMARLKIASANDVTITGQDDLSPIDVAITDLSDDVGKLVRVSGVVASRTKTQLTLEGDGGQITVIAKSTTDVSFETLSIGTMASITGVLTTYDGKLRLLPRDPTDLVVQSTPAADTTTTSPLVADTTPMSPGTWGAIISAITSAGVIGRGIQTALQKKS